MLAGSTPGGGGAARSALGGWVREPEPDPPAPPKPALLLTAGPGAEKEPTVEELKRQLAEQAAEHERAMLAKDAEHERAMREKEEEFELRLRNQSVIK